MDDDQITQRQYLNEFIERAELKALTLHVPFGFIYLGASLLEMKATLKKTESPPRLSRYRLVCGAKNVRFDTSRAKDQLQWKPTVSLREGLNRTFNWYDNERKLH